MAGDGGSHEQGYARGKEEVEGIRFMEDETLEGVEKVVDAGGRLACVYR